MMSRNQMLVGIGERPAPHRSFAAVRIAGLGFAVAINVIVVALLLTTAPARHALRSALPFKVSLPTLPPDEAAPPKPPSPKVKRKLARRDIPEQTIAPAALAPLAKFVPPEIATPQLTPAPALATAAEASPRSEPMPAKVPPRFDADYLQNPAPAYPPVSRRLGEQGQVMLRVLVDSNGLPEKIEVQLASGFERLDRAAIDTVAQWRFVPARQGDTAIPGWVLIPIKFALKTASFSDPS